ncbi:hypothetical protein [Goodfellowiella coeruleoviolacea]|uniref:hypothetical protein n=1 Tax=Goodfellowiella coeruleoviolacea TaxID=334858 RepID=UPI0020A4D38C|nr:hypothetical protein [Goodfellowiella coeruleoviolacea]
MAQQLATEQQRARDAMLDLAVYRAAAKHQADPDALLDSTSFRARVQALDPAASDFTSKLGEAIKKAVEDNPRYRAGTTPARSGAHITNGPPPSGRPKSLADAVRASYGT